MTTRQASILFSFHARTEADGTSSQSFHFQGFPATQVFERAGWIADPMYHNSGTLLCSDVNTPLLTLIKGDLSERSGYDLEQLVSIAKVQVRQESHLFVDSCWLIDM